ncbi:hypothetical protein [Lysobacter gummosus]
MGVLSNLNSRSRPGAPRGHTAACVCPRSSCPVSSPSSIRPRCTCPLT